MEGDTISLFEYEDKEASPDPINLTALNTVTNRLFAPKRCTLEKIAEGAFHKVYEVVTTDGDELGIVARVARPGFPRDKLESEIVTIRYIARKTSVPVPKVIAWNSDPANDVGAEYVFLSKIPGVSAHKAWPDFSMDVKKNMVRQVAKYMLELWNLRFDALGSLYVADNETGFKVGPIVSFRFSERLDGTPRTEVPIDLSEFRGPFSSISEYLASGLRADLKLYAERRQDLIIEAGGREENVESGKRAMEMALSLCEIYPGERPISEDIKEPISLALEDFTLSNLMIDPKTGHINGFIDFESTTTAPGWYCAEIPSWLQDEAVEIAEHRASIRDESSDEEMNGEAGESKKLANYDGKRPCHVYVEEEDDPPTEEAILQGEFLAAMAKFDESGSWIRAYRIGKPYRKFAVSVQHFITSWGEYRRGRWVDAALRWLRKHPNEGTPGNLQFKYPDIVESWK